MKNDIQVLILAGGRGTRLASVVNDVPKPMAPIKDRPFLEYLINLIKTQGFYNFKLLVGYKSETIKNYFRDGSQFRVNIEYSEELYPMGTGGAIKQAIQKSSFKNFLIFNGDTLFEGDLESFIHLSKSDFSIALTPIDNTMRYGTVVIDNDFKIKSFIEKGCSTSESNALINTGLYFFSNKILSFLPDFESFSIEKEVFPKLTNLNLLSGIPLMGKFIDIGIPEDFRRAQIFVDTFNFNNKIQMND